MLRGHSGIFECLSRMEKGRFTPFFKVYQPDFVEYPRLFRVYPSLLNIYPRDSMIYRFFDKNTLNQHPLPIELSRKNLYTY